jgi:iron(III) transport system ATP-binding protein
MSTATETQTPSATAPKPVEIRDLGKRFGETRAVGGLDLDLAPGEICSLLGPSGCGKTTTLRLIAGFERPDSGSIKVGDRVLNSDAAFVAPENRRISMVFQDYALFPHYTVAGNVAYALGRRADPQRVADVLELVGLSHVAARAVHELSGGQQQRVALARAIAPTPDLVLLDEPFSNLDAALRGRLRAEVREILLQAGVTALLVTHDQAEALSFADRVAIMRDGVVEQAGTPEEVYTRPRSRWVASFLGEVDVLPGTAAEGRVEFELGSVPADRSLEGPVDVLVRPESVGVGTGVSPQARKSIEGMVVARQFYGHDQLVELRLESGHTVRSRRLGFPAWHPGDRVRVWLEGPADVIAREPAPR